MLLGDLYKFTINSHTNNSIDAIIEINAAHAIFGGHFPELPVVPGVCQILMVKEIISEVLGQNMQLQFAKNVKFLSIINPQLIGVIQAAIDCKKSDDQGYIINATLFNSDQNFLKLKGIFSNVG